MGRHPVAYVSVETAAGKASVKSRLEAVGWVIKENCLRSRPLAGVRSAWRVVAHLYIARVGRAGAAAPATAAVAALLDVRRKVNWRANYLRRKIRSVAAPSRRYKLT